MIYDNAIKDRQGRWWAKDDDGTIHRFSAESSGETHWNGSIHVMGRCYGVRKPDATMMAASFGEVSRRIARRGTHRLSVAINADAGEIAHGFRRAVYADSAKDELFLGLPASQFKDAIYSNHLAWAPDGDEAFDDGSYVLQFEDESRVRLIALIAHRIFFTTQQVCVTSGFRKTNSTESYKTGMTTSGRNG